MTPTGATGPLPMLVLGHRGGDVVLERRVLRLGTERDPACCGRLRRLLPNLRSPADGQ
jgi:hypothetical protein